MSERNKEPQIGCIFLILGISNLVISIYVGLDGIGSDIFLYMFLMSIFFIFIGFLMLPSDSEPPQPTPSPPPPPPRPAPPIVPLTSEGLSETQFNNYVQSQLNYLEGRSTPITWSPDEHRKHPWSRRPGGCTVVVIYSNGACRGYDKVKRPHRYLREITKDYISNFTSNHRDDTLEDYIKAFYAAEQGVVRITKVWSNGHRQSPWELLERYATE